MMMPIAFPVAADADSAGGENSVERAVDPLTVAAMARTIRAAGNQEPEDEDDAPESNKFAVRVVAEDVNVTAGARVSMTLQVIRGPVPADATVLVDLPSGITVVEETVKGADWQPKAGRLTWKGELLNQAQPVQFVVFVDKQATSKRLVIRTIIRSGASDNRSNMSSVLRLASEHVSAAAEADKDLHVDNGARVKLTFAAGTLKAGEKISVREFMPARLARPGVDRFRLSLNPSQKFSKPVTVSVDLKGIIDEEAVARGWEPSLIYRPDDCKGERAEDCKGHEVIETTFNPSTLVLTAKMDHFTEADGSLTFMTANKPQPWKMNPGFGGISPSNGAVNFTYPIETPSIPDGLNPDLTVRYNSGGLNSKYPDDTMLGRGWSMSVPSIKSQVWYGQQDRFWRTYAVGKYRVSVGATDSWLTHRSGTLTGSGELYAAEGNVALRAWRCKIGQTCGSPAFTVIGTTAYITGNNYAGTQAPNLSDFHTYWILETGNGQIWVMGGTEDSVQAYRPDGEYNRVGTWYAKWAYNVDYADTRVLNPADASMEWSYFKRNRGEGANCNPWCANDSRHDARVQPASVKWQNPSRNRVTAANQYSATFEYSDENPGLTLYRLQRINVWGYFGASKVGIRGVQFATGDKEQMFGITPWAPKVTHGKALPGMSFGYQLLGVGGWVYALNRITNAYGGEQQFTYGEGTDGTAIWAIGSRHSIFPGAGQPRQSTTYDYGPMCRDVDTSPCADAYAAWPAWF